MPVNDCENNCTLKTRVDRLEKDFEAEKETNSQRHAEFYARIGNCLLYTSPSPRDCS